MRFLGEWKYFETNNIELIANQSSDVTYCIVATWILYNR